MKMLQSIRPFIGANNFEVSRSFYRDLGFEENLLSPGFSVFKNEQIAFYLQDAAIKDWIDNTQVFVEVANVDAYWQQLVSLQLDKKYPGVRLVAPRKADWGTECFLHDPSGILWHFGAFSAAR